MSQLKGMLINLARSLSTKPFFAALIRWAIVNLNWLFQSKKLFETANLFVISHPKPAYPIHFLILPKTQIVDIHDISNLSEFWRDVPEALQELVRTMVPEGDGYRVITNGGRFQEIPVFHIHFIAGETDA